MDAKYKITIPKPCHEDWNTMTPDTTGRFCGSCVKSVVDFTAMDASEIQDYFAKNKGKSVCGRFKNEQLESIIIKIPSQVLYSQVNFHKMFLLALLLSMGTTLFNCIDKNGNPQKIDSVELVNDSVQQEELLVGDVSANSNNPSFHRVQPPPPPISKIDEVKFVKEEQLKGKVNHQRIKSKEDFEVITTLGMVMPERMIDSTKIEKK